MIEVNGLIELGFVMNWEFYVVDWFGLHRQMVILGCVFFFFFLSTYMWIWVKLMKFYMVDGTETEIEIEIELKEISMEFME